MPRIVTVVLAVYSFYVIESSLPRLPARIPIHFNLAGEPNGWGASQTLWLLLGFQVLLAMLMLSMPYWGRRFPRSVHFGTRSLDDFTSEQRERVWPLLKQMAGWMAVATSLFFVSLIRESIHAARSSDPHFRLGWAAALFVGIMVGVTIYYVRRINQLVGGG